MTSQQRMWPCGTSPIIPNNAQFEVWNQSSFLRYHTNNNFLRNYGRNLIQLFKRYPLKYNGRACLADNSLSIPVVYDVGNAVFNQNLYGPNTRGETQPRFISFSVLNNKRAALALFSGVKPISRKLNCNTEHYCIGGGGYFPQADPRQCGGFATFDWDGYGTNNGWSASLQVTEAAVLIFYH